LSAFPGELAARLSPTIIHEYRERHGIVVKSSGAIFAAGFAYGGVNPKTPERTIS
jgi:hypothetical protein